MTLNIARFLNRTVLVSIPTLFKDGACRPYKLIGIELNGLWLQSEDLTRRLLSEEMQAFAETAPIVFVPFAQIAGVMAPSQTPAKLTAAIAAGPRRKSASARGTNNGKRN